MKTSRNYFVKKQAPSVDPDGDIVIEIEFSSPPSSVEVSFADLKYNKEVGLILQKDDGGDGDYHTIFKILEEGKNFEGQVVGPPLYSDGCGNAVKWGYGFAVYSLSSYMGKDAHDGTNNTFTYWDEYAKIVNPEHNFTLINHSYGSEYYTSNSPDREWQIRENDIKFWTEMAKYGVSYRTRHLVIPSSDEGYTASAISLGYKTVGSEFGSESGDGYWNNETFETGLKITEENADDPYLLLKRGNLGDDWNFNQSISVLPAELDKLFNRIGTGKWVHTLFSHGPGTTESTFNYFKQFTETLKNHPKNGDSVWIPSTGEFYDYLETRTKVIKSQQVVGNKLIISLSLANISVLNKHRDMSLLVKGMNFNSIKVTGAESHSFNPVSGLINVFKRKRVFPSPLLETRPPKINTAVSIGNTVVLNYNRAVTQSLKEGYEIAGATIVSLVGSGTQWTLTLNRPSTINDRLFYRMQRGDAMGADGLRVCSYIGKEIIK